MHGTKWVAMTMMATTILAVAGCRTCERPVTSLPVAAQKTIDLYTEGGNIHEMEMKEKGSLVLYKVEVVKADGSKIELVVNADGKLYKMIRKEHKCD